MSRILLVGEAGEATPRLAEFLVAEEHEVAVATTGSRALEMAAGIRPDMAMVDMILPDMSGIDLISRLAGILPAMPVVAMTAYASVESSVAAFRAGAVDYLVRPLIHEEIRRIIRKVIPVTPAVPHPAPESDFVAGDPGDPTIVGASRAIQTIVAQIRRVAGARSSVIILGETGTGKELFARAIHRMSPRNDRPFIPINCSAIPEQLLESELFGHARGAFTGAVANKKGLFEEADGGTLFLDEVGDLNLMLQAKLLRVLEDQEIRPVGRNRSTKVDVRFVFATHRDLSAMTEHGQFRDDLYYRINVVSIRIPPLRERPGDITLLVEYFLRRYSWEFERPHLRLSPEAVDLLNRHQWPGNVRELQNTIERASLLADDDIIGVGDLPILPRGVVASGLLPGGEGEGSTVDDYVRSFIHRHQADHTEEELAGMLGVTRKTLWDKRRRLGMTRSRGRRQQ